MYCVEKKNNSKKQYRKFCLWITNQPFDCKIPNRCIANWVYLRWLLIISFNLQQRQRSWLFYRFSWLFLAIHLMIIVMMLQRPFCSPNRYEHFRFLLKRKTKNVLPWYKFHLLELRTKFRMLTIVTINIKIIFINLLISW